MTTAFLFPGQGSQAQGMLAEIADRYPVVEQTFNQASSILDIDLWALAQNGPANEINRTENTQPLLLTAGYSLWQIWNQNAGEQAAVMAGHSLGEYTALTCAGAITFEDAVALVRDRGRYMQAAVAEGEGGMAAILGLDNDSVIAVCKQAANGDVLQAVNFNAVGQVVIAGSAAAIDRAVVTAKQAGAKRAIKLPVSIPAHSALMTPATEKLAAQLESIEIKSPTIPVIHNYHVKTETDPDAIRQALVSQLDGAVQWVKTIDKISDYNLDQVIECGPGKVLTGLVKRALKQTNCQSIGDLASIETLLGE